MGTVITRGGSAGACIVSDRTDLPLVLVKTCLETGNQIFYRP